ncbi:MAG TPA: tetratricopeptide repeat protein [Acidobacteriaceae bacterium]|nr:tetratricopeptide repeat protein [Acidobacteriaceae bacterium]
MVLMAILCVCAAMGQQAEDPLVAARKLVMGGHVAESESLLHTYIAKNPTSADAHFLLGYVYFREKNPQKSLAEFTAGARYRFPAADDLKVVASDYVLLGDFPDAQKWFSKVAEEKPNDADAWYLLGRTQYNEDQFADAIASYGKALALRPGYLEAENNMGLAWQGLNKMDKAMAAYRQAIAWQADHPRDPQPYLNLGVLLTDQGHPEEAIPSLRQAARLAPGNPKIHEEFSRALEASNRLPEAQHELEQAVALAPEASGPHFKLGRLYQREGLRELAQQQFAICQKLYGKHSPTGTPNPYKPH